MRPSHIDLVTELQHERLVRAETSRRAHHAAGVKRLRRRAVKLSQKARRVARKAERASSRARLAAQLVAHEEGLTGLRALLP